VLLATPGTRVDPDRLRADVTSALGGAGAMASVRVRVVDHIPSGAAGKRPQMVARCVPRADGSYRAG